MYPEFVLENFLADASLCRSVDCLLVKLSTAIYALEDFVGNSFAEKSGEELVREFLREERVQRVLASLAEHTGVVAAKIQSDPRFKNLRKYLGVLIEAIDVATQKHQSTIHLEHVERAPTWRVEQEKETPSGYTWKLQTKSIETLPETETSREITSRDETSIPVEIAKTGEIRRRWPAHPGTLEHKESRGSRRRVSRVARLTGVILLVTVLVFIVMPYMGIKDFPLLPIDFTFITDLLSPYKTTVDLGKTTVKLEGNYLIVEHKERWLPYLWLKVDNRTIHLTPYTVYGSDYVVADYVFVNSTHSKAVYSTSKILSLITTRGAPSEIKLIIEVESKRCYMRLLGEGKLVFTSCESVTLLPSYNYIFFGLRSSLYEVLVYKVNSASVDYLRKHLISSLEATTPAELVWKLGKWLEKNTEYDREKATHTFFNYTVYGPIEFFEVKRGVCSDYAVFTATALLSGGFNETYILVFNTDNGRHATAAVEINSTLYVLDQQLPVYEWNDYVEYVLKPIGVIEVIKVSIDNHGGSSIEIKTIRPEDLSRKYPDTYPYDVLPESVVQEAMLALSRKLGFMYTPSCSYRMYYMLRWEVLKAYTPVFYKQYVELLAELIEGLLHQSLRNAKCAWATIKGDTIFVYIG